MVLKLNKDLWDARTVQKCAERASADATAHVPAAASPVVAAFACCLLLPVSSSSFSTSSSCSLIFGGLVVDIIVKGFVYLMMILKLFVLLFVTRS